MVPREALTFQKLEGAVGRWPHVSDLHDVHLLRRLRVRVAQLSIYL